TLRVALTAPVVLGRRTTGRFVIGGGSSRLLVHVQDLVLPQLNPLFQPLLGVAFEAGTVGGELTAEVTGQGRNVALKGTLSGDHLAFQVGPRTWRELTIHGLLEANLAEMNRVSIYRAETEIAVAGVPCLRGQCTGSLDLGKMAGDLSVAIPLCNEKALLLIPEWRARPPLTMLDATANLNLILTATRQKTAGITGTINVVRLKSAAMTQDASPVTATLVVDGLATPADAATTHKEWGGAIEVRLNSIKGRFQRDDRDLADLEVGGHLFWPLAAGENAITTQSEFIDGRAVWAILGEMVPTLSNLAAPVGGKAAAGTATWPTAEPAPVAALAGVNLRWRHDCRRLRWTPLELTSLSLEVKLKDHRWSLSPLDCSLNGAPIELNVTGDCGVRDGYPFTVNLDVAGLDVAPLLAVFLPARIEQIQGRVVQLTVNASGKGITRANLTRSLRGNAVLHAADVKLTNLPGLDQVAATTGIDELRQLRLDTVSWRFDTLPDGKIQISEGLAKGPAVSLDVSGVTGWDERLDLTVALGVGAATEERLTRVGLTQLLGQRDGDYMR
ncbi:MAG: AsmA-like C-terminal region-containing protein, partial [bacterium]